jgi:pimeloyl-ACP methyl ester carboxylesterase
VRRLARRAGFALLALCTLLALLTLVPAWTAGIEGPSAVASLERVEVGGAQQWILVRGRDRTRPVLLFLHGGPGAARIALGSRLRLLEEEFVVVHWDQRGAGKSCPGVSHAELSLARMLEDTRELILLLRRRFATDRVILVGHSWGSVLGAITAARHPELVRAYVGVSQVVSPLEVPSARSDLLRTLLSALLAPEYTLLDTVRYAPCMLRSARALWPELSRVDLRTSFPRIDVPVYFIAGLHDRNTPVELVREYASRLRAPRVRLEVFERSGHEPTLDEPERFQRFLIQRLLEGRL